jgi:membrane protein YqaA with SNARE-associated domain
MLNNINIGFEQSLEQSLEIGYENDVYFLYFFLQFSPIKPRRWRGKMLAGWPMKKLFERISFAFGFCDWMTWDALLITIASGFILKSFWKALLIAAILDVAKHVLIALAARGGDHA